MRREYLVKGRDLRVVCGDRVRIEEPPGSQAVLVVGVAPRSNTLARWRRQGARDEPVAANLTQLVVVLAPAPAPDLFLADRHLCAAELMGCRALLLWNKSDVAGCPAEIASEYGHVGYEVVPASSRTGEGLARLRAALAGHTSVLVGQSGVGKSSLTNALVPGGRAAIGELSAASATGSHTTTAVLMYAIPESSGGRLLDTPGVRDFVPALGQRRLDEGFPEVRRLARQCRFADCRHDHEPGCAVKDGIESGAISRRRYESYRQLAGLAAGGA